MSYKYSKGSQVIGDLKAADDTQRDTLIDFGEDRIDLQTSGSTRFKISGSDGAITFNEAYTFPTADGTADQVLQTDGLGNLTFAASSGGGGSSVTKASSTKTGWLGSSPAFDNGETIEFFMSWYNGILQSNAALRTSTNNKFFLFTDGGVLKRVTAYGGSIANGSDSSPFTNSLKVNVYIWDSSDTSNLAGNVIANYVPVTSSTAAPTDIRALEDSQYYHRAFYNAEVDYTIPANTAIAISIQGVDVNNTRSSGFERLNIVCHFDEADAGGGGSEMAFKTITVAGQSDIVADLTTDTLGLVAGSNVTITTDAATDQITIAASGNNTFQTISVSGQNDVVADSTTDTLGLVAGSNVTITTNAATDQITIESITNNVFEENLIIGDPSEESGDDTGIEILGVVNSKNMLRCVDSGGESITSIRKNSLGKTRFQINNSGDENNINEGGLLTVTNIASNVDPGSTGNPSEAAIFMCGDGGDERDGATLAWGSRNGSNAGNNSMGAAIKFHNQVEYAGGDLKFYIKKATGAADQSSLTEIMEFQGYGDGSQNQGNVAIIGGSSLSNTAAGIGYLAIGSYSNNTWGAHTRYDNAGIQCMEDSATTADFEIQKYGGDLQLGPQSSTYNSGKKILMSSGQVYIGCGASQSSTDCDDIYLGSTGTNVFSNAIFELTTTSDTGGPITFVSSTDKRIARFTSDERLKLDIQNITGALEKIEKIQPRSWIPNGSADANISDRSFGFIAQEVLKVVPELVTHRDAPPEVMRGIAHYSMQGWIVAGMKELIQKNKELEDRIAALESTQ